MKIPIFASVIAIVFALLERLNGEKKHPSAYFVLFLLILGSMYFAVAYCDEPEREEQFVFGDYYDEKEIHYEPREFKFVPDGTPPKKVGDFDGN